MKEGPFAIQNNFNTLRIYRYHWLISVHRLRQKRGSVCIKMVQVLSPLGLLTDFFVKLILPRIRMMVIELMKQQPISSLIFTLKYLGLSNWSIHLNDMTIHIYIAYLFFCWLRIDKGLYKFILIGHILISINVNHILHHYICFIYI